MTKDDILEYFKDINHAYNDCTRYDTLKRMLDELQAPCDDAISRQAVLSHAKTERGNGHEQPFDYVEADVIRQLPPVKPTEKVGHWIPIGDFECRCSECRLWCYKRNATKYCPYCGAKMQEVEE